MGFFKRRDHGEAAATTNGHHRASHAEPYSMSTRPTFGVWLKHTWLDIVTMAAMGALGLGIYMADPAANRSFPVTFSDGEVVYPQFAYPLRKEVVPIWLAAFLAAMVPILFILLAQIRVRSFWDANNGIVGLLYSLITAAVFQVWVKWLIGGLRPHFLDVCKPDISLVAAGNSNNGARTNGNMNGNGYQGLYYTREICTGDTKEINDSLESFPSGHTTAAFAGFVFLYLYLNAKLKVFSNYHPAMWKLVLLYCPILGAVLIGGALTIDEYHNWYDVFAGAAIGTTFAFSAYRMTYAAIWDWRFNHIPLNRVAPFAYGFGNGEGGGELLDAVVTRRVGWGDIGGGAGHGNHHQHATESGGGHGFTHPRKPVATAPPRRAEDMV